jgi:hypothetical protein
VSWREGETLGVPEVVFRVMVISMGRRWLLGEVMVEVVILEVASIQTSTTWAEVTTIPMQIFNLEVLVGRQTMVEASLPMGILDFKVQIFIKEMVVILRHSMIHLGKVFKEIQTKECKVSK